MSWRTTSDLDRFAAAAGGYLRSRAAENALLLSAAQAAHAAGRPPATTTGATGAAGSGLLFGWWEPPDGNGPRGAFLHDPAVPLLIAGRTPELAAALAATLAKMGRLVCGVDAATEAADAFAAAWSQRAGAAIRVHRHCRVYRLAAAPAGPARPPPPLSYGSPGRLRVAAAADRALLIDWLTAYAAEAGERIGSPSGLADDLIGYGGAVFWEIPQRTFRIKGAAHFLVNPLHREAPQQQRAEPADQPVALAVFTRPVAETVRIAMVYTPPERRRNGYAAAVTLAVSRALLGCAEPGAGPEDRDASARNPGSAQNAGRALANEVILITDGNRPDRRVARLGYQLAGERTVLRFGPPTGLMPRLSATGPMPRLPTGPLPRPRR